MMARMRAPRDLAAEARGDVLDAERVGLDRILEIVRQRGRLVRRERLGADLEALVVAVRGRAAALDDGVRLADACAAWARTCSSEVGCGVVNEICVPPSKSMPRLRPRTPSARIEIDDDRGGDAEPEAPASLMKSILSHGLMPPPERPITLGFSRNFDAGEQREEGTRREDGGEHRDRGTDQEHEREAAHRRGRDREEDEGGDRRDDVGVDDRVEALRVAGLDRGADTTSGARLFLDAFEDDDVRVGGHPERQHEAGEAREGQRHVEDQDRGVEERGVDAEPEHGDEPEEAVEDQQEEGDEQEADDRRLLGLVQRVLAERGRDRRLVERDELDGQGAGLEDEREVLRLTDVADARDLGAVRAGDAAGILLPVDRRPRLDLPVEHDREVLRRSADPVRSCSTAACRAAPRRA